MAKNDSKKSGGKTPAKVKVPGRFGGWKHPLALGALLLAIVWVVGTVFATTDKNFPNVGEIPGLFDLGRWNYAIAAVLAFVAFTVADRTRPEPPPGQALGNRWAAPAMIASAVFGLLWIVVFYVTSGTDVNIPVYTDLGNWNVVIGMGFIIAAFGFATKWE
ncbi:cell division protein CrgA [Aeromicrobium sp. Root495]|uniref:cell division protein CrgA n=1 Tax=Aeromicrobium sp. Root495 TaxID=1736550 RepID=UPI0009EABA39|nr:cell division protein CrgA [Aeromicrobium sp. Root495]